MHNPFSGKDQPWDPYGVAKLDMSGLLLGQRSLHINVPIHQCDTPDVLGVKEHRQDGKLMGVAGAVDGPGLYLKFDLAHNNTIIPRDISTLFPTNISC